ncbi:hypothetical protein NEHOM01_0084 [Nematocida homosporus]|uniref:uncharacterized protein n=1 Tax=Nematocida homosporus TaxID=1912981 RepID=UPI0022209E6B|nr:uncharacterized protein NEHOM01_0084 [Nematocida homosporus]KAI5184339.1 hypothetical protein NEHOM01_0084 [Nematocida homosporus]
MGIRGVWKMLKGEEVLHSAVAEQSLCVDANFVLFGCLHSTDVKRISEYTLKRVGVLLQLGIDPIFVFDGQRPMFKRPREIRSLPRKRSNQAELEVERDRLTTDTLESSETSPSQEMMLIWPTPFIGMLFPESEHPPNYAEMELEEFSNYQIDKIAQRHKHIRQMTQQRMHGESNLTYKLQQRIVHRQVPERSKRGRNDYHQTVAELDKLKELVGFDLEGVEADRICSSKTKAHPEETRAFAEFKRTNNPSTVLSVPAQFEKSEWQREMETYDITKKDIFLAGDSVAKQAMPFGYRVVTDILDLLGIKYAISPAEADPVYSGLEEAFGTEGVITDDSDVLLFSAQPVLRHFFKREESLKLYKTSNRPLEYSWIELVLLAWLLGSDYSPGINGIGPKKAARLVQLYREEIKKRDLLEGLPMPANEIDSEIICRLFQQEHPEVSIQQHLLSLSQTRQIYTEVHFKVKVENAKPKQVIIPDLINLLNRQTHWAQTDNDIFLRIIDKINKQRLNQEQTTAHPN